MLRQPGCLFFTYPREGEVFTSVPRPAPLGIADGTSDGVSDVVTTTSRSPLTVLPIDDVGPTFHVSRTLHEMSPAVLGLTKYHHTGGRSRGLGSPVVGQPLMDATPNRSSEFTNVGAADRFVLAIGENSTTPTTLGWLRLVGGRWRADETDAVV